MPLTRAIAVAATGLAAVAAAVIPGDDGSTAPERYVSPAGHDDAAGTARAPWRTLQHAADAARPGTVVHVRPGSYAGFRLERSGGPGAPVVFRGPPRGQIPLIRGPRP